MVYFITDGTNYVKIGYAYDVDKRIKNLQMANPRNLYCLLVISGDIDTEHLLHEYFKDYRIKVDNIDSCEWFYISGELKQFLDMDSIVEIEDYLAYKFPKKRIRVILKKENVEKELFFLKTQNRKQNERIKELEKQVSNQQTYIKKLKTKIKNMGEKENEDVKSKRCCERVFSFEKYANGDYR